MFARLPLWGVSPETIGSDGEKLIRMGTSCPCPFFPLEPLINSWIPARRVDTAPIRAGNVFRDQARP